MHSIYSIRKRARKTHWRLFFTFFPLAFHVPLSCQRTFLLSQNNSNNNNTSIFCFGRKLPINTASFWRAERQNNWKLQVWLLAPSVKVEFSSLRCSDGLPCMHLSPIHVKRGSACSKGRIYNRLCGSVGIGLMRENFPLILSPFWFQPTIWEVEGG